MSGLDLHSGANNTNSLTYSTILYVVSSDSITHHVLFSHTRASVDVATVTSLLLAYVGTAPSGNRVTCMQCTSSDTPIRAHTFVCVVSCNLHLLALSGGLDFAATAPEFHFGSLRCRCQHQLSARTEHALTATSLFLRLRLSLRSYRRYTDKAAEIIADHAQRYALPGTQDNTRKATSGDGSSARVPMSKPMFLYLPHQSVHVGNTPTALHPEYALDQAPAEWIEKYWCVAYFDLT